MLHTNLSDILQHRGSLDNKGILFIDASNQEEFLSYKELYDAARRKLFSLQKHGLQQKNELVFQIESHKSFVVTFWACVLGGIVPVPLTIGQTHDQKQKLFNVWSFLNNPFLIINRENGMKLKAFADENGLQELYSKIADKIIFEDLTEQYSEQYGMIHTPDKDDIAFVQFSSGSTGNAKGVTLTHQNLIANMDAISTAAKYTQADSMLSWMPLTHDMGLIGFHLNPLFVGMNQYLIPTHAFVRKPALWLEKASEHRATILCSPNFGYKYVLKHCGDSQIKNLDLSSVRILYNGAEPISESICNDFISHYSKFSLKKNAMCPVYGLAEASLAVSISNLSDEVLSISLDRDYLRSGDLIAPNSEVDKSVSFVNVGKPINNCAVRISYAGKTVKEDVVGEIQLKGISVTRGYYNNPEATRRIITRDGWVKTGDLGFKRNGCLYITGRAKDVIFKNGKNYYSNDIERIAEEVEGIELNKIVVAGLANETTKLDEVVAFVFYRADLEKFLPIAMALNITVNSKLGFELDRIIPVRDIPRTTSGKLQRFKLVDQYKSGLFADVEAKLQALAIQPLSNFKEEAENGTHRKLLSIWRKVLKNDAVTIFDKFFEIGGNSLKAAEICMLVANELNVDLPIQTLYEKQTIDAVGLVIESLSEKRYLPIPTVTMNYYPLASQQKGIFNFWQIHKTSVAYNIPVALKIRGKLDIDKLTTCISDLIARHDSLRMLFPTMLDSPKLQIADSVDFSLESIYCEVGEVDQTLKECVQPFDLNVAPLFRMKLIVEKSGDLILFADFHHAIADGLSVYNFLEELLVLYSGKALPSLLTQYKDYTSWQEGDESSHNIPLQKEYWIQRLKDDLPLLEIPTDFVRLPFLETVGKRLAFNFDAKTILGLKRLARDRNITLHSLLFATYCVLLSKYTNQEDLVIGIPASGRSHPDLKFVFGMFVNNLPIKISVDSSKTFNELLVLVKESIVEALAHQEYPFEELVKAVSKKRDISRNVLFDTMFMYRSLGISSVENSEITLNRYFFDPGFSKFDLSFEVIDEGDELSYEIEYSSQLFAETSVKILAVHFNTLIENILNNPDCTVANLSMINTAEYEEHVVTYNQTKTNYPNNVTVFDLFRNQVETNPQNIAITFENTNIRYGELYHHVNILSFHLIQYKWSQRCMCAIVLPRGPKFIISILAILKAGGCYLPIDPELPEDRIKYFISNSQCAHVISEGGVISTLKSHFSEIRFINIDDIDLSAEHEDVAFAVSPKDLAYVIYTSGTTGEPKGVMIEHCSLVNYTIWAANTYLNNNASAFSFFTSVSFDLTITSIFTPLITGKRIIIYKENNAEILVEKVFADDAPLVVKLTPSHLKLLVQSKLFETIKECNVRTLVVGGEQLETSLARQIQEKFKTVEIFNEYGPTEATVGCMIYRFNTEDKMPSVPIGKPAANTQIYVLDKFLKPAAVGSIGELYVSGDGVSRGYLHNASLTASKFVSNPFANEKKMYRTGDLVKWLPGNNLEFVGRFDQQVKINGYRIELLEIENQLKNYPGITGQVVVVQTKRDQKYILAYYQSMDVILERELRNYLSRKLPYYMIPSRFVHLEKIPLTKNGKVNYDALPSPPAYEADRLNIPQDDTISISIDIWQDVLGEAHITPMDNFFELGGDSIKAVQIASKLYERGIVVDVKDILVYQSIAEISGHATRARENNYEQDIIEGEKKLSPTDLWFFDQKFENPNFYNQSVLLTLKRKVQLDLLNQAFQKLITHHDGLRLNYDCERHTMFYNNVHLKNNFSVEDFSVPAENYAGELIDFCHSLKSTFDIEKSLLIKAGLIHGPNDDKLFITAHHLIVDGFSWRIFLEDFYTLYCALEAGSKFLKLPAKTASLRVWTNIFYERSEAWKSQQAYWREIDALDFTIPQDMETNDWTATNLAVVTRTLDRENTNYLMKDAHKVYDSDVLTLLNTALALTINTWIGRDELVIEHENHGRHLETVDTARTLGWFTAIYPVRLLLEKASLGDQILSIKKQLIDIPDRGLGYAANKHLNKSDSPNWNRLLKGTEVRLNYLGQFDRELDNSLFTYSHDFHGYDVAQSNLINAKLEFNIMSVHGMLHVELKYNRKAYRESTVRSLIDFFLNSLTTILEHIREERILNMSPKDFDAVDLKTEEFNILFK